MSDLKIWNGREYRYYDDDELAYAASLLKADGEPDEYGFTTYVLKDKWDEAAYGHFRYKAKELDIVAAELILIAEKRCPLMQRIQEEKKIRNKFLDIPERGPFWFVEEIITYDYPEIFVCIDKCGQFWLFEDVDDDDDKNVWVAVRMSEEQREEMKMSKRSIQSVFREAEAPFLLVTYWWNGGRTACRECEELPYPGVAKNDTFLKEFYTC